MLALKPYGVSLASAGDLVEVVEALRDEHGPEDLFLHDAHRAIDVGHDGRLHVEAPDATACRRRRRPTRLRRGRT